MIKSGWSELIIAGGVESMSRVPMGIDGSAWLMEPNAAFGHFVQGISADLIATRIFPKRCRWLCGKFSKRAAFAQQNGFF
jgi:acetyl-CoA C-acetyltransferase